MPVLRTIDFTVALGELSIQSINHALLYSTDLRERFRVLVTKDNLPVSLADQTIAGYVLRPDGATVSSGFTIEKEVDGTGYAAVILPPEAYAIPGPAVITIMGLDASNHPLPLLAVRARVAQTVTDTVVDPGQTLPSITELQSIIASAQDDLADLADYNDRITDLETDTALLMTERDTNAQVHTTLATQISLLYGDVAPTFSESVAYSVGDFVIWNCYLFRFKANHAAGAWNAAEVDQVTVGELLHRYIDDGNGNITIL